MMRHLAFLLPLLLATSLAAEPSIEAAKKDDRAPSFYIEEITVEGSRHVSSGIIIAESLLETGTSYTEDELREAVNRIKRLPFLLGVDFELRKGGERGRYVLVIAVLETTRFFYAADFRATSPIDSSDFGPFGRRDDFTGDFLVGYRYFVGNQGLLYMTAGDIGAQIGYSSYNFLKRNVFLDVSYDRNVFCCDTNDVSGPPNSELRFFHDNESEILRMTVGIPRSARQLWRIDTSYGRSDSFFRQVRDGVDIVISEQDSRAAQLQVSWIYDTTDDPVFPSRGDELVAKGGVMIQNADATDVFDFGNLEIHEVDSRSKSWNATASLTGRRHYPIGRRQSLAASLNVGVGRSEYELDVDTDELDLPKAESESWGAAAAFRHAVDLVGAKRSRPQRRLRWENGVEYSYGESSALDLPTVSFSSATFRSELIYRSRWGVLRLSLRFIDILERQTL